jgi:hypothetical protein
VYYVLSESVDIQHPRGTTLTIVVASDKDINYNEFDKRIAERWGYVGMMPLCSFKELMAMNSGMDSGEAQFQHDVYGGSARNFNRSRMDSNIEIVFVEETMLWYFGATIREQYGDAWMPVVSVISAEFGKSKDKQYNVMNSLMRHFNVSMTPMWASKFMEVLASVIYEQKEPSMYEAVAELLGNAALGTFFECISHRKLTALLEKGER